MRTQKNVMQQKKEELLKKCLKANYNRTEDGHNLTKKDLIKGGLSFM